MHRPPDHAAGDARPPVFIPYEGTEGYTPAPYLPYVAAAFVARLADLDFVATMYLMRLAGLAAMTAVMAYAVAATPTLKWAFLFIAMLPTALFARSVIKIGSASCGEKVGRAG